jgi:hypothetical protein
MLAARSRAEGVPDNAALGPPEGRTSCHALRLRRACVEEGESSVGLYAQWWLASDGASTSGENA